MSRIRTWFTLPLAALALGGVAPGASGSSGQTLSFTAGLGSLYDDNILEYSEDQIREFERGLNPDRYAIQTRDDLVVAPTLSLSWEADQGAGRRHLARLRGEGDYHQNNANVDFGSLRALWRESWSRDRRLSLSYSQVPRYYLRQLLDDDSVSVPGATPYGRAEFRLQTASTAWTQRLAPGLLVAVAYRYEGRDYNRDFDERDSRLHRVGLELSRVRLPRHATASLGGGYRVSRARATDGNDLEPLPDPDVSYHGLDLDLGGRVEFARSGPWRLAGDVAYDLETRTFDSDRPTDKYHYGRHDLLHAIEVGARAAYRPHIALRAFYHFETNAAHLGSTAPLSSDAGSHRASQVGLALEWSGNLWHSSDGEGESEAETQP